MKKLTPERWLYHAEKQLYYFRVSSKIVKEKKLGLFGLGNELTFSTSDSIRGVLSYHDIEFGRKFYVKNLIRVFDENKIKIPKAVRDASDVDKYEKISLGFPHPRVTHKDLKESYVQAKYVYNWAKKTISNK